jgi:hypothetical protein
VPIFLPHSVPTTCASSSSRNTVASPPPPAHSPLSRTPSRPQGGWNVRALAATALGAAPCAPGFLGQLGLITLGSGSPWKALYDVSMFVGIGVAAAVYTALMGTGRGTGGEAGTAHPGNSPDQEARGVK